MRTFTRLQQLNLTDEQWEDILPKPEVPNRMALAREACRDGCITHAMLELWVNEQLKFIASEALLTFCMDAEAALVGCWDYSICLEDETSNPAPAMLWKCSAAATHSTASASLSGSAGDPPTRYADEICLCILTWQCRDSSRTSPKRIID